MNGIVKWFDNKKGFGFITTDEGEAFVHYNDIISEGYRTVSEGERVTFTPVKTAKGLKAEQVKRLVAS